MIKARRNRRQVVYSALTLHLKWEPETDLRSLPDAEVD